MEPEPARKPSLPPRLFVVAVAVFGVVVLTLYDVLAGGRPWGEAALRSAVILVIVIAVALGVQWLIGRGKSGKS